MRPGTFIEAKAWPIAPRPFPEEAMGSWIGRVAARYRVTVEQLCGDGGIALDASGDLGWLMPAPLPAEQLRRLARLGRLDPNRISAIEAPASWRGDRIWAFYCATCVFLNAADVMAPRWKRAWLDPSAAWCDVHDMQLETIPASSVRSARISSIWCGWSASLRRSDGSSGGFTDTSANCDATSTNCDAQQQPSLICLWKILGVSLGIRHADTTNVGECPCVAT